MKINKMDMEKDYELKTTFKDVLYYFKNMFIASAILALVQSIGYSGFVESNVDLLVGFKPYFGFEFNYFIFLLVGIIMTFIVIVVIDIIFSTIVFFGGLIITLVITLIGSGIGWLYKVYKKRED